MTIYKGILIGVCLTLSGTVLAQQPEEVAQAFKSVKYVNPLSVVVPTVVEVPLENNVIQRNDFAVYEVSSKKYIPYFINEVYTTIPITVTAHSDVENSYALVDNDLRTSAEYYLSEEYENSAMIVLRSEELIESSSLVLELDRYVALPVRISISAFVNGTVERTIVAPTGLSSKVVTFPKTLANRWTITLNYVQPLRINELRLVQDSVEKTAQRGIRFLGQPQASYLIYHDPDRFVRIATVERGNLALSEGVQVLPSALSTYNTAYKEADADGDGIIDLRDNCVQIENADQTDIDRNGRGDACDDFDRDGVTQNRDNCPNLTNVSQEDTDGDGIGDVCDTEESRFTEKYPWVPWAGMGIAVLVLGILFVLVGMTPKNDQNIPSSHG